MSDRDRLLEIWNSRVPQGLNYASKDELEASVKAELLTLAVELHANNFFWPAEAIAGFLLGKTNTLDEAFGLRLGKPFSKETLRKDANALQLRLKGKSYNHIAKKTNMDRKDVRGICECRDGYERRCNAAYAEILGRQLELVKSEELT